MSDAVDGASFVCDSKAESLSDCVRVDSNSETKSSMDSRYEKETDIGGRDDSQPSSSYIDNPKGHSTHSNQETVRTSITTNIGGVQILAGANTNPEHSDNRMELEDLVPKDHPTAIHAAASIIALSRGDSARLRGGRRRKKDPIWRETEAQAKNGDWEGVLNRTHQCLLNPMIGYSQLNMESVSVESYLLTQANAKEKSHLLEHYEAVNNVLSAYKDLYEKKIDAKLAKDFQQLSRNFTYLPSRINMAQVRYDKFMHGKKFMISKSDQKLLDDLVALNNSAQVKENAKSLYKVAKVFGWGSSVVTAYELATLFNKSQETGDWREFGAKISQLGSNMLIGLIVGFGITASSLPVAIIIAGLGVLASNALDDSFWLKMQNHTQGYLAK
ncbi:colicin-like pore-forming protein [Frederiksenia canicola]|uniref:Colicin pore forming domain-containing protein n=1 Tax=Frederiksenia canicola TaxID=123824 RepID=A0AAE7C2B5_9PAST|nr:colicin-like pore-forming protein [Frederiksenia canicola]QIM65250.1 hypothetical protein A4G17_07270 [Frederiksenia canicola]RPE96322.1 colicin pore forming domain-containing protein [Frederiksenia canicola]